MILKTTLDLYIKLDISILVKNFQIFFYIYVATHKNFIGSPHITAAIIQIKLIDPVGLYTKLFAYEKKI